MGILFGTDGVRGVANKEITGELAYKLARSGGSYLLKNLTGNKRPKILIGKDTRLSGDMLESALTAGFTSLGIDVIKLGIIPTPGVAFLTDKTDVIGGVMISASHNPIGDNGIKFFAANGYKLTDEMEEEIENIFENEYDELPYPTHQLVGRVEENFNLINIYLDHLISTVDNNFNGLKVVLDCANGAAYHAAPFVLEKLGAELIVINNKPAGDKINVNCGSTYPQGLIKKVKETDADLGIAHDGDADRVVMVDDKGNIIDGDTIMAICALDMLDRGNLQGKTLVTTRYSNLGLKEVLEERGGAIEIAKNGDRYVLKKMKENNYNLGGEKSGHIIFLDHNKTGDGILTALQVLQIVKRRGESLNELSKIMTPWPQKLANVKVAHKDEWKNNSAIIKEIEEAEKAMGQSGRVFVRASGTEPVIRLMLESKNEQMLDTWVERLKKVISRELN